MIDVMLGLLPVLGMAVYMYGWYAVKQVGLCMIACVASEALFTAWRGKSITCVADGSAKVTGMILGLSLPWSAPWYVAVVASVVAIGIGKVIFGGLGQNIFNPAMVGRAFVMISFAGLMGATAYTDTNATGTISQATPLTDARAAADAAGAPLLWALFLGTTNGSLGATSAIACLLGGLYMCVRRVASWEIPAGSVVGLLAVAGLGQLLGEPELNALEHLFGGAFLFGAFFIATDPCSSPLTPRGKWIFGIGFGVLVMLIRQFSSYPEGVLFAVLLMNALTPLINCWCIPRPLGGPVPAKNS